MIGTLALPANKPSGGVADIIKRIRANLLHPPEQTAARLIATHRELNGVRIQR
jgi:hypothetical protein